MWNIDGKREGQFILLGKHINLYRAYGIAIEDVLEYLTVTFGKGS